MTIPWPPTPAASLHTQPSCRVAFLAMTGSLRPWTLPYTQVSHQGKLARKPQIFREKALTSQWSHAQLLHGHLESV